MQWEGKPWHGLSYELKKNFGCKVIKLSLDGGFTCPNRDGTLGTQGCSFCGASGSGEERGERHKSIPEQIAQQRSLFTKKWPHGSYIAYFQSFTGTYGDPEHLKGVYQEALDVPGVQGIAIATRPDCLSEEVLEVLEALQKKTFLWVELGLQTVHNDSAKAFGRGYDWVCFEDAWNRLQRRNIRGVVHLINGLPGETREMMVESARVIGAMNPWGVKLHLLHVVEGTRLEQQWLQGQYCPMTLEEYVAVISDQLEVIPPEVVIHRLTGDGPSATLKAPQWSRNKRGVLGAIEVEMRRRGSWQGCRAQTLKK